MLLSEIFEDLCARFIVNIPPEETKTFRRLGFQLEQAFWFYEENYLPLFPYLPKFRLKLFFQEFCAAFPEIIQRYFTKTLPSFTEIYDDFIHYKFSVPCAGAIILNKDLTKVLMVKGVSKKSKWGFPRGKINKGESFLECAIREVFEETGVDISTAVNPELYIDLTLPEKCVRLFIIKGLEVNRFKPLSKYEISDIVWMSLLASKENHKNSTHTELHEVFEELNKIIRKHRGGEKLFVRKERPLEFVFDVKAVMTAYADE